MKCQALFSGENTETNITNLLSAGFAERVQKVKYI